MGRGSSRARDRAPRWLGTARRLAGRGRSSPTAPAWLAAVWIGLLGPVLLAAGAGAQHISFGKNKVSYHEFEWSLLQGEHIDLYCYPEEEELARIALAAAEESYGQLAQRFVHEIEHRVPIILYSSQHDFEQTRVTSMLIPEGVAGLTESMRGRVLIPFDGSLVTLRETIQHELGHAFQLSMSEQTFAERFRRRMPQPPLWFTEGTCEHVARTWDADTDLILRDLVLSGQLPPIDQFWRYDGTFTLYKLGQSVLAYVAEKYGDDKIALFYSDLWKVRTFSALFPGILGVSETELSEGWTHWLRRRYYPDVLSDGPVSARAERIGRWGEELKPTPVPPGVEGFDNEFVFISPHSGYLNIYRAEAVEKPARPRVVVSGQRSAEFLSFHAFRSRMDVSGDGLLVFSSHHGDRDEIMAYDLVAGRIAGRWGFDDLVGITSPQWDRAGARIVFSGLSRDGFQDLYVLDVATCKRERLTRDRAGDTEPAFHPDGTRVVFVSDRGAQGDARNLFEIELATHAIRRLTQGAWWDLSPSWSPDGQRLLFVSTRDGLRNLYVLDGAGRGGRVSRALEAILDPRWLASGREAIATVYREGRFETFRLPIAAPAPGDSIYEVFTPVTDGEPRAVAEPIVARREAYRTSFALEAAQGGVAVDPGLGSGEGLQILLRDLLGNRLVFLQLGNTTISTRDFLDNFSAGATYVDLTRRLNRGFSLYHHAGHYFDEVGVPYFERRVGAMGLLSYPLSRFARLETSFGLAYAEKEKPSVGLSRDGAIATHYISWTHDNSLWTTTGPIDGDRMHVTLGLTMNLKRPGVENVLLLADARRYVRVARTAALALRLQVRASGGPDPQVFLLGGSHSLRGYRWRELYGTRSALANVELRFPVLRRVLLDPALIGPLYFPGIQGALFADAGNAWYRDWSETWAGSYGIGLRMGLGGMLVLRYDLARKTDFVDWPRATVSEFFVGWNY